METNGTQVYARLHADGLTLPQQSAVDLLATGKTDTQTAELLGLHRTTVSKWRLYHPEFQAALNRVRAEVWGAGIDRLRSLIPAAVNVLAETICDIENPERVRAATALLKLVPLSSDSFAPGPGDADEIVRLIVEERRRNTPSRAKIRCDLTDGILPLDIECLDEKLWREAKANGSTSDDDDDCQDGVPPEPNDISEEKNQTAPADVDADSAKATEFVSDPASEPKPIAKTALAQPVKWIEDSSAQRQVGIHFPKGISPAQSSEPSTAPPMDQTAAEPLAAPGTLTAAVSSAAAVAPEAGERPPAEAPESLTVRARSGFSIATEPGTKRETWIERCGAYVRATLT